MGELTARPATSVVIPVLNAEPYLPALLDSFARQAPRPPGEVILVDSGSTDRTVALAAGRPGVRVIPIERFSHGRARNLGALAAGGEVVVFLSQDALPADERWLAELLAPFDDPQVAAAYSRQIPRPDANPMERHWLESRVPDGEPVSRAAGPGEFSMDLVFFSNVSSAVRREALLAHPFDEELIMSEDQQFSRDVITAGMAVVYQPHSVVVHSHNYSLATCSPRASGSSTSRPRQSCTRTTTRSGASSGATSTASTPSR